MAYRATVELLLDVNSEAEACDAVAEILRENTRKFVATSCLVDWRHASEIISLDFDEDSPWPAMRV